MRDPIPSPRRIARLALPAAALLLGGCILGNQKTAGVDEFPNSIYARVNTYLEEGKKSEDINSVSAIADTLLNGPGFHVGAGKVAVVRKAAASVSEGMSEAGSWGLAMEPLRGLAKAAADTGCQGGIITITDTAKAPLKTTVNTLSVCMDAKALDTIKGNETIVRGKSVTTFNTGRVESADITDADGDGILNAVPGKACKAQLVLTTQEKGILEKTVLVVGPGPDNNFDTEADNLVYTASWSKTSGADTLATASYADADSDGVAVDNGKASLVDLDLYQKGPSDDHPDAVWTRAQMRLVVRYHVDAKEVKRVRFEMEDKAGRQEVGEIFGRDGSRDFDMRDTVEARFLSVGTAAADSLDSMDVRLTMKLGADFDSKADDSIYAITLRAVKKIGEEKSATFSFRSDRPIPSGQDPQSGDLTMEIEYQDGTTLKVEGSLNDKTVDLVITDRTGKRVHAVWDRAGRGISLEDVK
jgi:hypothetical protein